MLIALPRAPMPHAVLIIYFTQSTNVANRLHIWALGDEQGAHCVLQSQANDGKGHHYNDWQCVR